MQSLFFLHYIRTYTIARHMNSYRSKRKKDIFVSEWLHHYIFSERSIM